MFKIGDKVMANGFPGKIVEIYQMVGAYIGGSQPYGVKFDSGSGTVVQFEGEIGFYKI